MSDPKKPIVSFGTGPFSVALWENTVDNSDGTQRKYKSVSLRKSFMNKKNEFDDQTMNLGLTELGCVKGLLDRMADAVIEKRQDTPF